MVAIKHDGDRQYERDGSARQRAAEMILSTPNLTDELTDAAAQPLLEWGVSQAEETAGEPVIGQGAEAAELLAEGAGPVRRIIKVINSLAADRRTLEPVQVAEELALVLDLADRLPRPPVQQASGVRSSAVADLAAWQTEMDDRAFVRSVLALLQGPVVPGDGGTAEQENR